MGRTYNDAITALNTLQSNFAAVQSVRQNAEARNKTAIPEMIEYVHRLGYEPSDFDRINPIHIAGTKGKGSTSAFISSILCQYLPHAQRIEQDIELKNVGLYTSPHLRSVRERIQINNAPISEEVFTRYFFETWDRLEEGAARRKHLLTKEHDEWLLPLRPMYFRFLTLMAFHTFMSLGVDTAIIECGIGGEYDSTNVLIKPRVCGITSLGIDHTALLGDTIESIAWHKAGIMKQGVPCFSAPQPEEAVKVLEDRAKERIHPHSTTHPTTSNEEQDPNLHFTPSSDPRIHSLKLGLAGDFQRTNASLAISISQAHLSSLGFPTTASASSHPPLPQEFIRGLESVHLPGRCEIRLEKDIAWYIDGGHTLESIKLVGEWFASHIPILPNTNTTTNTTTPPSEPRGDKPRILFFNQQTRNAPLLAQTLHSTVSDALSSPTDSTRTEEKPFTHAIFTTNTTHASTGFRPELQSLNADEDAVKALSVQKELAERWADLDDGEVEEGRAEEGVKGKKEGDKAVVEVRASIEEGVGWCRDIARLWKIQGGKGEDTERVMVLVTGSVHLVGGFLEVLETEGKDGEAPTRS